MTSQSASLLCLLFVGAIGWFDIGMIAQGFQPSPKISSHGPAAVPSDWPLEAKKRTSADDENENKNGNRIGNEEHGIHQMQSMISRRSAFSTAAATALTVTTVWSSPASAKPGPNGLILSTAPESGLRWADAKVGSGDVPSDGSITSIDYSMASTAGRFPSIYSTKNGDEPYRWKLGDGSTIRGIEMAILGDASEGIPPMRPGGIRRVIVPNNLGYNALIGRDKNNNMILKNNASGSSSGNGNESPSAKNQRCLAGSEGSLGPIPPKDGPDGAYQRWYQFYCNPRIPYQPDLVLDIKLYGKRGTTTTTARAAVASE